jgi:hypothetical protein
MSAQVIPFPARRRDGDVSEPWLDGTQLGRHFGVSDRTVRRWRAEGMPSKLLGGSRRYRISEAERWHSTRESE